MDFQGPKPLPRKLYLQLDNSAKDNKNKYLMAFLSLLTTRGVFKEIQVGFLLVGHTHEDIAAYVFCCVIGFMCLFVVRVIVSCISCIGRSPDRCYSCVDSHFSVLHCRCTLTMS